MLKDCYKHPESQSNPSGYEQQETTFPEYPSLTSPHRHGTAIPPAARTCNGPGNTCTPCKMPEKTTLRKNTPLEEYKLTLVDM